jgi:hypothetical protein
MSKSEKKEKETKRNKKEKPGKKGKPVLQRQRSCASEKEKILQHYHTTPA